MVGDRSRWTAILGAALVACSGGTAEHAPDEDASASGGSATLDGSATSGGRGGTSPHPPDGGDGGLPGAGGSGGSSPRDSGVAETGTGATARDGSAPLRDASASADGSADAGGMGNVDAGAAGRGSVDAGAGGASSEPEAGAGGSNGAGGASVDAGLPGAPRSCEGLPATCGPNADEDCCASPLVKGGTFSLSYDAVTYTNPVATATVSDFRLDRFEVTVGRFRKFVAAWVGGWRPAAGSGKHTHLNGGQGLAATTGGYEPGWYSTSSFGVPSTKAQWDTGLTPNATFQTWTSAPGANETRPINYATWVELYAFCIWDGGFLPSEAEWNYAAAGGADQRAYPWSVPPTSTTVDCTLATYDPFTVVASMFCSPTYTSLVGALSPAGDGKYGQADLAGNMAEWVLDLHAPYTYPCADCTNSTTGTNRVLRGGSFLESNAAGTLLVSYRTGVAAATRYDGAGARCARAP